MWPSAEQNRIWLDLLRFEVLVWIHTDGSILKIDIRYRGKMLPKMLTRKVAGAAAAAATVTAVACRGASSSASAPKSFYDIVETTSAGEPFSFEQLRGKVCYGVNVASR